MLVELKQLFTKREKRINLRRSVSYRQHIKQYKSKSPPDDYEAAMQKQV